MANQACCNCLGCQAHQQIMIFQNLAYERQKEIERLTEAQMDVKKEDPDGYGFQSESYNEIEIMYHDENTMFKVKDAMLNVGISPSLVEAAINQLQNDGIFFRERRSD